METNDLTIGEKLSPVLEEIESALWEHEAEIGTKPNFTTEGFRAACKIFMSALTDKLFEKQKTEGTNIEIACKEAAFYGEEMWALIKRAINIDTRELYKK